AKDLGITLPPDLSLDPSPAASRTRNLVSHQALGLIDIKAAGTNHFTWVLSMHHKQTGEDLYPLFRERIGEMPDNFQPLSRDLMDVFGLFPVAGDDHLSEYVPWVHDPQTKPWEKYQLQLYAWDEAEASREAMWGDIESMGAGQSGVDRLREVVSEGAVEV